MQEINELKRENLSLMEVIEEYRSKEFSTELKID